MLSKKRVHAGAGKHGPEFLISMGLSVRGAVEKWAFPMAET